MQKSLIARIGAVAAVIVATGTLAGCTFGNRGVVGAPQGGTVNYNTDNGTGQINIGQNGVSISGTNGNSSASFGQSLPNNWPSDLPTPDGATLTFGGSSVEDGETSFSAIYTSTKSVDETVADMKSKFTAAGWTVAGDYSANYNGVASASFGGEKGENSATVVIGSDSSNPGQISVTIGGNYKL